MVNPQPGEPPAGRWAPVPPAGRPAGPGEHPVPFSANGAATPTPGPAIWAPDPAVSTTASGGSGRAVGAPARRHSRTGAAWVALGVAAVVLVFFLIFILQNSGQVQVQYFGWQGTLRLGVAMMFVAVAGAFTVCLLGTVRFLQFRGKGPPRRPTVTWHHSAPRGMSSAGLFRRCAAGASAPMGGRG